MVHKTNKSERGMLHYYIDYNDNPDAYTIVFTHGIMTDHNLFKKQLKEFRKKYNIITWDLPLHGRSKSYQDFSFKHCAMDLKAILDKEGIKRVILVGMSMGGFICQEFYHLFPDMVIAFIGIDSSPLDGKYYSGLDFKYIGGAKYRNRLVLPELKKSMMAGSASVSEEGFKMMLDMMEDLEMEEIYKQWDSANKSLIEENKEVDFKCPVLLLVGDKDFFGKTVVYNKSWSMDKGYPLVYIDHAGHLSNIDNYKEVNSVILDFLNREVHKEE